MTACQGSSPANPNIEVFKHVPEIQQDRVVLESLMYQYWKPDTVTAERKRIRQTWFDYRHLHPVQRSFVFVREYERAHQRAFKKFYGEPKQPGQDLPRNAGRQLYRRSQQSIRLTVLKMQLIDELGCPYDTYFDAAFEHFMQDRAFLEWRGNSEFLDGIPLPPLSMMADARTVVASQKFFERKNSLRLRVPVHPHYRASNWVGTVDQKMCAKWLIKSVQNRGERDYSLARLVYELDLLRENEIVKHLGIDVVKRIRSIKHEL